MAAHTENEVVINAPLELVWRVTNELEQWPALFTEYATVEVLERKGSSVLFRLTMHPDENGKVWSWVSRRTLEVSTHQVSAERVETGPFEYMKIHWSYEAVEGGTRMRWEQDFQMKPTAPVTDEQMARRINTNSPEQMRIIKEKLESGAFRRPA
ncbi:MAG TPA: SRPBCC family protein [Candidatus Acidoferrales bacterium]|nr:SRPBCC family protein [Candidatus Acidoferrales bacterium]